MVGSSVTAIGAIRDNVIGGSGGAAISAPANIAKTNNRTGTIASMGFVDAAALDFRLSDTSEALDAGTLTGFPADDFDGVLRPQGGMPDQGAFEFVVGEASPRPNPPALVQVQ